jgi:hypothetical protein
MKICSAVLWLLYADRQTDMANLTGAYFLNYAANVAEKRHTSRLIPRSCTYGRSSCG